MYNQMLLPRQPMDIRFEFRPITPSRKPSGSSDAKPTHDGVICAVLIFTEPHDSPTKLFKKVPSTPYATEIKTFRSVWDGRKAIRVGAESRELANALSDVQATLEAAHSHLEKLGAPVSGQSVMNAYWQLRSGRRPTGSFVRMEAMSLPKVYEEFLVWKESCIEPNRRKRQDDQISQATYDTYPRRWVMIMEYLAYIKSSKLSILLVNTPFTTNFKEWLRKHKKPDGQVYAPASINKAISLLKMLTTYALSKGYIDTNPIANFACRGGSPANPKPLTEEHMQKLETCELPSFQRWVCDSWLVAAELCKHYSDYMELRGAKIEIRPNGKGIVEQERSKQAGMSLKQTINVTQRAHRIIEKWGGLRNLYYKDSANFSKQLKIIAKAANIRDEEGEVIGLQFGQGRDTGLTDRAIKGANNIQLTPMGGWSRAAYANRYLGLAKRVVDGFVDSL
ncbi:hypothetical protein GO755_36090 [Spirosoma sp. HMF4905]|uniref:Core-binding (CB) domain-containing protein n=1 Tax=Spirosoma arboris TaxID=2682092 RepID=A0A7K1SNX8_9BACT|nr:phage integrase SAM-like domain-containing protein [Spirosoma arboris]MVM35499.1 hypothetical protein [Spirosoma arboris]